MYVTLKLKDKCNLPLHPAIMYLSSLGGLLVPVPVTDIVLKIIRALRLQPPHSGIDISRHVGTGYHF